MEQTQFTAVVLLTLLMLKLLLLPNKVVVNPIVSKARWLMIVGIALLALQFLLQYTLGLRKLGVTQAVMLNLLLFIPSSWAISLSVIYLQCQGHAKRVDKMVGGITWTVALVLMGIAIAIDGQPLLSNSPMLHWAEVVASGFYLAMQGHYAYRHFSNLRSMRLSLQNYYDHDMGGILVWMKYSTVILLILALMVPMLIFVQRQELALFAILFFAGIFYLVDSFCYYMVSSAPKKMAKAEEKNENAVKRTENGEKGTEDDEKRIEDDEKGKIHSALIAKWVESGGYRKNGLTLPSAAMEIGIPRYLLTAWLRQHDLTYTSWITDLRIEEAKRVIKEHPQWTNESVAQHCGFSDRSYFQKKFKEKTGLSPAEYQAN